ncbi:MAG: metallophosphoesterase family protein [Thermodesulfovibrionales bacterium]
MKIAIISDVHSNLEALESVLKDIRKKRIERILFLGDAVGYGPNPNNCIDALKKECEILLAGNHDRAAVGMTDIEYFNEFARAAIIWTAETLTEEHKEFLYRLPISKRFYSGIEDIFLVHSTPKEPESWHYLLTLWDAEVNFNYFTERICLLGHSHVPFIIERKLSGEMMVYRDNAALKSGLRYIINAGSVGQPRDGDPRACYAIMDGDSIRFVRIDYNIKKTQMKMVEAGLPKPLIDRLEYGT